MFLPKHVEQLRNTGIINSTTGSHLVGSSYEIYTVSSVNDVSAFGRKRSWPMRGANQRFVWRYCLIQRNTSVKKCVPAKIRNENIFFLNLDN